MGKTKIAITIDEKVLLRLDQLVSQMVFLNRSRAIEDAILDKLERIDRTRLARELTLLDPEQEKSLAEAAIAKDRLEWPES
jgi:metal-responsive CopG/Arc/MetJ family transcriptional regulator